MKKYEKPKTQKLVPPIQIRSENSSVGEILNRVNLSRKILVAVQKKSSNQLTTYLVNQMHGSEETVVPIRSDLPSNVIKSLSSCHCH